MLLNSGLVNNSEEIIRRQLYGPAAGDNSRMVVNGIERRCRVVVMLIISSDVAQRWRGEFRRSIFNQIGPRSLRVSRMSGCISFNWTMRAICSQVYIRIDLISIVNLTYGNLGGVNFSVTLNFGSEIFYVRWCSNHYTNGTIIYQMDNRLALECLHVGLEFWIRLHVFVIVILLQRYIVLNYTLFLRIMSHYVGYIISHYISYLYQCTPLCNSISIVCS